MATLKQFRDIDVEQVRKATQVARPCRGCGVWQHCKDYERGRVCNSLAKELLIAEVAKMERNKQNSDKETEDA